MPDSETHARAMSLLGWLYGSAQLLRSPNGTAYPVLFEVANLVDPEAIIGPVIPDHRSFPSASPTLERLQARGAYLWNGPTYVLRGVERRGDSPRLVCSGGRYFDALNTCSTLRDELFAVLGRTSGDDFTELYRAMPLRRAVHTGLEPGARAAALWQGEHRSAALSISCLFAVFDGEAYRFCSQRRSDKVAEDAGAYHVVPSMQFQPSHEDQPSGLAVGRVHETILRELAEELFGIPESIGGNWTTSVEPPAIGALRQRLADGRAELRVSGVAMNLLDLRPEIIASLVVRDGDWLERYGSAIRACEDEFVSDPEGRSSMHGTQAFRRLDADADLHADGAFAPERSVPGGAAALIAALPVLARPGRGEAEAPPSANLT